MADKSVFNLAWFVGQNKDLARLRMDIEGLTMERNLQEYNGVICAEI